MKVYSIFPKLKKFDSNYSWDHDEEEEPNTNENYTDDDTSQTELLWDAWHDWDRRGGPPVRYITASKSTCGR